MGNCSFNHFLKPFIGGRYRFYNRAAEPFGKCRNIDFCPRLLVQVALVERHHNGNSKLQQLRRKEQAAAQVCAVHNVDDDIRVLLFHIRACDALLACEGRHGVCAGKVYCNQLHIPRIIALFHRMFFLLNGNARPVGNLFISSGQRIVHRGLAGVWIARKSKSHLKIPPYMN